MMQGDFFRYLANINGVVRTDVTMPEDTTFGFRVLLKQGWWRQEYNDNTFGVGCVYSWPYRKCATFYKSQALGNILACNICDGNSINTNYWGRTYQLNSDIDQYIEFDQLNDEFYINGVLVSSYYSFDGNRANFNTPVNIFNIAGIQESNNKLYFEEFYIRDSNGLIIHDFIPTKRNDLYGILDKVTHSFYEGDGTFEKE